MKVKDYMTKGVKTANYADGLTEAANIMQEYNVGCVPIEKGGHIIGVLTDRDIVIRGLLAQANIRELTCEDIMTREVINVDSEEDALAALSFMAEHKIRRLIVTENGKFTGIVSIGDIATGEYSNEHVGKTLSKISEK